MRFDEAGFSKAGLSASRSFRTIVGVDEFVSSEAGAFTDCINLVAENVVGFWSTFASATTTDSGREMVRRA